MRKINGIPLTTAVGINDEKAAISYVKNEIYPFEPNFHRLRIAKKSRNRHLTRTVNKPEITRAKYLIGQTCVALGLSTGLTSALVDGIPGAPAKSLIVAGIGAVIGANGYAKSVGRWYNKKSKLSELLEKANQNLIESIENVGRENFTKATLSMGLIEVANGIETRRKAKSFDRDIQMFNDAVELVCGLADKAVTPQDFEQSIKGLDKTIEILRNCIGDIRQDLAAIRMVNDRTIGESRFERNASIFLPHAQKAFAKLNASRNLAANIESGIISPLSSDRNIGI